MAGKPLNRELPASLSIESIDADAQGVAHHDGKVIFVRGALPGEQVRAAIVRDKPKFSVAELVRIERASCARVQPRCPHFGVCGGCAMQHLEPRAQVAIKQRVLEDTLWHVGRLRAQRILRPLAGPSWGYRFRARLSVRNVPKKGGVLVGFHERSSSYVAEMSQCPVLPEPVSALIMPLRELIGALAIRDRVPQIELAIGEADDGSSVIALVLRHLLPVGDADRLLLRAFARRHRVQWWLQSRGPDSIELLDANEATPLQYRLAEFGVTLPFRPTDFTQVNHLMNAALVSQALALLAPRADDRCVDLFCGLGNFSLPLATRCAGVIGIEGADALVERASANAAHNRLAARAQFRVADLFKFEPEDWRALGRVDRLLIDPPREGALAVAHALAVVAAESPALLPRRVVYVSCNPATLARDAAVLVQQVGFQLDAAGIVNMFPHTTHVESIATFDAPG